MEYFGEDPVSIAPLLPPLVIRSPTVIYWPPLVLEVFKSLNKGPDYSNVNSGQTLALAICNLRNSLGLPSLHPSASLGFSLFFDDLMNTDEAEKWFKEVVPRLSGILLGFPSLLETHFKNASHFKGIKTELRLLEPQQSGIVFLSQELIGALLENKIKCLVHYFEKICSHMPTGNVSFERKVLHLKNKPPNIVYPEADFWSKSTKSLCKLEVRPSGLIEDQSSEALEVDFANKYIGGGALRTGCVQEEIRFMINPELIFSMFFLPSMADNEAIEIVGAERFSNYRGYASSFRFSGDHEDKKGFDSLGRRRTRIVAIDALCNPGKRQYRLQYLLREINKAFCGFLDQHESQLNWTFYEEDVELCLKDGVEIGVVTGNWGCGAFGGDPEVKAVVQWLAASEAQRPFILYCTFGLEELQRLELVVEWILSHKWTVGELWEMLVEYSAQRLKGETSMGLFNWLLPSLFDEDPMMLDVPDTA